MFQKAERGQAAPVPSLYQTVSIIFPRVDLSFFKHIFLSSTKDMNLFHNFCESLFKRTVRETKLRGILFLCFTQFTLFVYKYLIIVVEIFQKYH